MGRPPKKIREPQKRQVSLVEIKAQCEQMKWQTEAICAAPQKLQELEVPAVEVRGPARFQRNTYGLNGYLADLSAAVTRLQFTIGRNLRPGQGPQGNGQN